MVRSIRTFAVVERQKGEATKADVAGLRLDGDDEAMLGGLVSPR